jgi:membrane protease YdiL (CAAX protease family)
MLAEKSWQPEAVARTFLGIIGTLCMGLLLADAAQRFIPGLSPDQKRFIGMVIIALFFQVAVLVWVAIFLKEQNCTWNGAFGICLPNRNRAILLGIIAGMVVLPLAWGLQVLSGEVMSWFQIKAVPQEVVEEIKKHDLSIGHKIYFGILAIVIAPVAEETLFRGLLYPTIKQTGYRHLALWGTSILFSLFHLSTVTFVPLVVLALLLVLLYEETNNLLAPIVAHSSFNAANFVVLLFEKQIRKLITGE